MGFLTPGSKSNRYSTLEHPEHGQQSGIQRALNWWHARSRTSDASSQPTLEDIKDEVYRTVTLAWPLAADAVVWMASSLIMTAYVGHYLSSFEMSAWFLAQTVVNITGTTPVFGVVVGMETSCGQAYGARQYGRLGVILQRSMLLACAASIPIWLAWTFTGPVLVLMGQDPAMSAAAARNTALSFPMLFGTACGEALRRYLSAQGVVLPCFLASLLATALTPAFCWAFVVRAGWGLDGVAAVMAAYFLVWCAYLAGTCVYLAWVQEDEKRTWQGWSWECLDGLQPYLVVAAPSLAMACLEWWAYSALVLLAGMLPDPEVAVAAAGVAYNTHVLFFSFVIGLSIAASARVANELGACRPAAAKLAAEVGAGLGLGFMAACAVVLIPMRRYWALLFSRDPAVVNATMVIMLPCALSFLGQGVYTTLCGVVRGAGRQSLGARLQLGIIWLLGLPNQALWGVLLGYGVAGLWWGQLALSLLLAAAFAAYVMRFDWRAEADKAAAEAKAHEPLLLHDQWDGADGRDEEGCVAWGHANTPGEPSSPPRSYSSGHAAPSAENDAPSANNNHYRQPWTITTQGLGIPVPIPGTEAHGVPEPGAEGPAQLAASSGAWTVMCKGSVVGCGFSGPELVAYVEGVDGAEDDRVEADIC